MNKIHFLQKFASIGVAAFSAIYFTGIATNPTQAATLLGEFEYDDGTSNFFEDVNPEVNGDTFSITFSPEGEAATFDTSGIFTPPLPDAPPGVILDVVPETVEFTLVNGSYTNDLNPFEYELAEPLQLSFNNGDVIVEYGANERFLGVFEVENNERVGISFEEEDVDASVTILGTQYPNDVPGTSVLEELAFSDLPGGEFGGYEGLTQVRQGVPEPATILGLLTIGGLGLGLNCKKKSIVES